jgi:hypothetical protein
MRTTLVFGAIAVLVAAPAGLAGAAPRALPVSASASTTKPAVPSPTERVAGPQHWCSTNGVTCADPSQNWEEWPAYDSIVKSGVRLLPYIGHDEPMIQFFSNKPGSANDVTYQLVLPKDPPTPPKQDGSGGNAVFQQRITFWFGMQLCDDEGSPNPDGQRLSGHPTIPCRADSDANLFASPDKNSPRYFGYGPGQGFMEMQFYPPGWAAWPAGIGCTAHQWCSALNIDTFQDNENTGTFNNNDCLSTVGPEPVNFAFVTKDGRSDAPGNAQHPEHFVPDVNHDFLMSPGDRIRLHMHDSPHGFTVDLDDVTAGTHGSMVASAANGFGSVVFAPHAARCTVSLHDFHPMYSTASPATRNFNAAHTGNISFADEIGHFEYCAKVRTDALGTCAKPLGDDTNDPDNQGPDPLGDDVFCLPGSASTLYRIGGCLNTDGDFDSVSYKFSWPGSIANPTADALLNAQPVRFTSPLSGGSDFSTIAFESNVSRSESDDTEFGAETPCQRHVLNPADPHPGVGCVNPPPGADFYPFYSTTRIAGTCLWQQGGPYIPGTTDRFGGSAKAEYGPLRSISYPTAPVGAVTKRLNDFRSATIANPCRAG